MLHVWLENALAVSGLSQADLSRALTAALGRSIDQNQISRMLKGQRKISGDELIEIAQICSFPVPISQRAGPANQSIPTLSFSDELLPDYAQLQTSVKTLKSELKNALLRLTPQLEKANADIFAEEILFNIQRSGKINVVVDMSELASADSIMRRMSELLESRRDTKIQDRPTGGLLQKLATLGSRIDAVFGQLANRILDLGKDGSTLDERLVDRAQAQILTLSELIVEAADRDVRSENSILERHVNSLQGEVDRLRRSRST